MKRDGEEEETGVDTKKKRKGCAELCEIRRKEKIRVVYRM
jgi:hypothetical protein